jgi:RNA ligase
MKITFITLLEKMIAQGFVRVQQHPTQPFSIYNYTASAQYERCWNEATLACRGLILDAEYNIVARPFAKFFNFGEQEDLIVPNESFEVFEKMDGSLGILYWCGDVPHIASRGSFTGVQALHATRILHERYKSFFSQLDKNKTYLFEIIYPENRIVVNYGDLDDLVLLAVIDNETGEDGLLPKNLFSTVKKYDGVKDINNLKKLEKENHEGFVILFASGLRLKVKFDEYCRIHKIITQISNISIWTFLKENKPFEELLERVPDEFYTWVRKTKSDLIADYQRIESESMAEFKILASRKETAAYFINECQHTAILFAMLDEKDYASEIWKLLRPKFSKPFSENEV